MNTRFAPAHFPSDKLYYTISQSFFPQFCAKNPVFLFDFFGNLEKTYKKRPDTFFSVFGLFSLIFYLFFLPISDSSASPTPDDLYAEADVLYEKAELP